MGVGSGVRSSGSRPVGAEMSSSIEKDDNIVRLLTESVSGSNQKLMFER